jgi:hypothetical protein
MKNHQSIYQKKCPTVSVFVTAIVTIKSLARAYTKVHYYPQAKTLAHSLMMSSIHSHPEIETSRQKSIGEKSWKDDIINGNSDNSQNEACTTTVRRPPLDFFSAMFGTQASITSVPTKSLALADEIKMQPEMWDFIQAGLVPYYEAVYGLQESLKFKFSIASSQIQMPLNKRILKVR